MPCKQKNILTFVLNQTFYTSEEQPFFDKRHLRNGEAVKNGQGTERRIIVEWEKRTRFKWPFTSVKKVSFKNWKILNFQCFYQMYLLITLQVKIFFKLVGIRQFEGSLWAIAQRTPGLWRDHHCSGKDVQSSQVNDFSPGI